LNSQPSNNRIRFSPALAAALLVAAVAATVMSPSTLPAQSRELTLLSADVVNLENRVIEIQRTLDSRDERVLGLVEQLADSMAAISSQMERLSTAVGQIRMDTSGLGSELSVAVRNLSGDVDMIEQNLGEVRADMAAMTQQLTMLSATTSEIGDPDGVLRTARTDISQGNFQLAREGYDDFLRSFPTSPRAAEAQMGLGDAYFEEGLSYDDLDLLDLAIVQYDIVLQRYPNSATTVDALHKKGLAQIELGDETAARETLTRLIEDHPESIQAVRAEEELAELD
jgi:TolA-binding protein